ncbi:MAG: signal peptide peptidase [Verrucomicrobiales bacterium]|nr:signal peptide peptidase [Verrucomicrobiales bacterium]
MKIFGKRLSIDIPLLTSSAVSYMASAEVSAIDVQAAEHPYFQTLRKQCEPKMEVRGDMAFIPVQGALAYNPDPWEMLYGGMEDSRAVLKMFQDAYGNSEVKGVLVKMDTPGGMMIGGPEISDMVKACREAGKPVVTHIGGLGASLGYMIAAPSTRIVSNRSAISGSIGVIASLADYSGYLEKLGIKFEVFTNKEAIYKGAGALGTTLSDPQREQIQASIESAFAMFKSTVLQSRPGVKPEAMQGQTFRGEEAKKVGLVDAIGDENYAVQLLRSNMR